MKFDFLRTDDGVKLGYSDRGKGIPVVLMAGYRAPATAWYREEKTLLNPEEFNAIMLDFLSRVSQSNGKA